MTFNFNMGNDFSEIYTICQQYPQCNQCPLLQSRGLIKDQSITYCEKIEELLRKEQTKNAKTEN